MVIDADLTTGSVVNGEARDPVSKDLSVIKYPLIV
jgi:hypothetical protein